MTAGLRSVEAAGRAAFPGFRLRVLERTPSTQDVVRAAARAGAEAGFCCVAMAQTAGRGRQGRPWTAPPGSALLVSVLMRVGGGVAGGVPLLGGVAVCDALAALGVAPGAVGLKWPNDVLVRGSGLKLAGVLAEVEPRDRSTSRRVAGGGTAAASGAPLSPPNEHGRAGVPAAGAQDGSVPVALGIGLNLAVPGFPPDVPGASLHTLLGRGVPWEAALAALLTALGRRLAELDAAGLPAVIAAWRPLALGLGAPIEAITPTGTLRGTAVDVAPDGALLVATDAGITPLVAGDVHLLAPPAPEPAS